MMQIQKGKKQYTVLRPGDPWDGQPGYVDMQRAKQWIADRVAKAVGTMPDKPKAAEKVKAKRKAVK